MDALRKTTALALVAQELLHANMCTLSWSPVSSVDEMVSLGFVSGWCRYAITIHEVCIAIHIGNIPVVLCCESKEKTVQTFRTFCDNIEANARVMIYVKLMMDVDGETKILYCDMYFHNDIFQLIDSGDAVNHTVRMRKSEVLKFRDIANAVEAHT
jgi:hypothetical protein